MFPYFIFLVASSVMFLCSYQVSSCDYTCADKPVFTPLTLTVKYGDPASATCVVCKEACHGTFFDLEKAVGKTQKNGTTLLWTVDSLTEWDRDVTCYYNTDTGEQCCSILAVIVYQPPQYMTISFVNHTGPMSEGDQYILQCSVQNVAPVQNLTVTFYRGQTTLDHLQSNSGQGKKPVSTTFTLSIIASREHDGAQYWCEAQLELGPEGPQPPPVVMSEKLNTTVHYLVETTTKLQATTTTKTTTSPATTVLATTAMTATTATTAVTATTANAATTAMTATTAVTATTVTTATTANAATTARTTTAQASIEPNSSASSIIIHRFMCLMLLFSVMV